MGNNYADWLAPDQHTPSDLIGTAYWALVAREMVEMSKALNRLAEPTNTNNNTITSPQPILQPT